jgi:hypothetical protein
MLIGSIGIVLCVPVTTALAVLVADTGRLRSHHSHAHDPTEDGDAATRRNQAPSWDDFGPRD